MAEPSPGELIRAIETAVNAGDIDAVPRLLEELNAAADPAWAAMVYGELMAVLRAHGKDAAPEGGEPVTPEERSAWRAALRKAAFPVPDCFGPVPERVEITYCTVFCGDRCTCRLRFRRPDGSWSCTRDHVTEPCGDCDGCRQVATENRRGADG